MILLLKRFWVERMKQTIEAAEEVMRNRALQLLGLFVCRLSKYY